MGARLARRRSVSEATPQNRKAGRGDTIVSNNGTEFGIIFDLAVQSVRIPAIAAGQHEPRMSVRRAVVQMTEIGQPRRCPPEFLRALFEKAEGATSRQRGDERSRIPCFHTNPALHGTGGPPRRSSTA